LNTPMKSTPLLLLACMALLCGCKKFAEPPPDACFIPYVDFVATHVNPSTLEVTFTAITAFNGTITSHEWDFGDGTTFSGPNPPPHRYPAQTGNGTPTYRVRYRVANECGEAYWTRDITLTPCLPNVRFAATMVNDSTVQFVNNTTSPSPVTYQWNFGDGGTSTSSAPSITRTYAADRSYTVTLRATNACGENFFTVPVVICRRATAVQAVEVAPCGAVSINASASRNAARYQWNFGNGVTLPATPSANPQISYTYPSSGSYIVTLTVINGSGCDTARVSTPVSIAASALEPNTAWSYTSDDLEFNFSRQPVQGATSYTWNFGDNTQSNQQNPGMKVYANPGNYTLTLGASNGCATTSFTSSIQVPFLKALNNTPSTDLREVAVVSPTQIYYLGANERLYRTDTAGNWSAPINLPSRLNFNSATRLYVDPSNNLWIYGRGEIARFNPGANSWTSFFSNTGYSNNTTVNGIAVDASGTLWSIDNRQVRRGNTVIGNSSGSNQYSAIAFAPGTGRIWISSDNQNSLYYVAPNSNQLSNVSVVGIIGGASELLVHTNGDLYLSTSTGIIRTNSQGAVMNNYNLATTGGVLNGEPASFELDAEANLWAIVQGRLVKVPVNNPSASKNYSFTAMLNNLVDLAVLQHTPTNSDLLLAKNSPNAAVIVR
jgi:PKD repeat protein